MQEVIAFILVGALGGLVRALYGIMKAVAKNKTISIGYFLTTIIIAGAIGGILGSVFNTQYNIAALTGYVGTDILENVFKATLEGSVFIRK
ncbi:hypothetical protein HYX16_06290 [Candidatus Woesearchaeota archaeon]|nr:hypothetical protein [Candidatus Woesearchaeota archaeon]